MKFLYTFFILFIVCFQQWLFSQNAPVIEWQKSLGGTNEDAGSSIRQTGDGGFIIAGDSYSSDNDVTLNHGAADYWIVRTDVSGYIQWQVSLGGSSNDIASDIQQTTDNGYIVTGFSRSDNGDVTDHHGNTSYNDYWVVKLDSVGTIDWEKSLGGTMNEFANAVLQTDDGGFVVAGYGSSNDGDVTGHHGGTSTTDFWIVKLDTLGNILWEKSLGGNGSDNANAIQQTADGGFIVAGSTSSNDNDVSGNHGLTDYWVVKLDSSGDISWQKAFGGTADDYAYAVQQTNDGGFIAAGWTNSDDGDVTENQGSFDYWVVKLDANGNLEWQKSAGGIAGDFAYAVSQTSDNGYAVAGYTASSTGDVTGYHGGAFFGDYWIVKLDASGNLDWQKCLGGSNDEYAASIQQTIDGGLIVAGWTESNDGDVTFNYGSADVWIVQLGTATSIDDAVNSNSFFSITPNPATDFFNISLQIRTRENFNATITITNLLGETIFTKAAEIIRGRLDEEISLSENLPDGMYLAKITFGSEQMSQPILVSR